MSTIKLENMEFYAYHGCMEHEKKIGNTFFVTVAMELDTEKAGKSDNLNDTLSYQEVYDVVKKEMEIPANLIEHVSQRIIDSLMNKFTMVNSFTVKLSKLAPPLGGKVDRATIEITKKR